MIVGVVCEHVCGVCMLYVIVGEVCEHVCGVCDSWCSV